MLTRLVCKNFKSLRDLDLALGAMTVLVGPNSVGKTTVLEAVRLLSELSEPGDEPGQSSAFERLRGWASDKRWVTERRSAGASAEWLVQGTVGDQPLGVRSEWDGSGGLLECWGRGSRGATSQATGFPFFQDLATTPPLRAFLFRPTLDDLTEPSYAESEVPTIGPTGYGIPSVIANLAATAPDTLTEIIDDLRAIVPSVRRCRAPREEVVVPVTEQVLGGDGRLYERAAERRVWGNRLELEMGAAGFVPAAHVSEGTLRALAILCAVATAPKHPFVVLCDDFDAGLHPLAQIELVKVFRRLIERRPALQFLCTTHSPYVLDAFEDHEVIALARGPDGGTVARKIAEHPDWPRWKSQLRVGEFWSSMGDEWVAARNVSPSV